MEQIEDNAEGDRGNWKLLTPLIYMADNEEIYTVPKGFVTDFASIPRIPIIFDSVGDRANLAATLHDWCYATPHPVTRERADWLLREGAVAQGCSLAVADTLYDGVRMFGEMYWK